MADTVMITITTIMTTRVTITEIMPAMITPGTIILVMPGTATDPATFTARPTRHAS